MPKTDHASERLSRKAKRLDSREWRGTLAHALLKSFLLLFLLLIFSLALKLVPKRLDIESLSLENFSRFQGLSPRIPSLTTPFPLLVGINGERVPVPQIFYTSASSERGAFPYSIMSWIDGILLSDVLSSQDERAIAECAHEIGSTLANIGTYTFPRTGLFGPDLTIVEDLEDVDLLSYFEHFLFAAQSGQRLGTPLTQRVWRFLTDHAAYFDVLKGARSLVHSDFKCCNILVRQVRGHWTVAGVLDWEWAFAGSPLVDIGNMLRYSHLHPPVFERAFLDGYQEQGGRLPAEWKRVAKLVDLLSLCEFLNSPTPRDGLVQEVTHLITGTLEQWEEFQ